MINTSRSSVHIQLRVATQTATGETVVWTPVETRHAQVIPLDAAARLAYQQVQSQVTHKVVFWRSISLSLGNNRILWGSKTLEPVEPPLEIDHSFVVMTREV